MELKRSAFKGLVMKGLATPHRLAHVLDEQPKTGLTLDALACQQRADTKPFKGRGGLSRFIEANQVVDKVKGEMDALVRLTLEVPGRTLYLCVHRRAQTGQHSLRWRKAGIPAPHVGWVEFDALVQGFPPQMAAWYRQANRMARELNEREIAARAAAKRAKVQLGSPQHELSGTGGGR